MFVQIPNPLNIRVRKSDRKASKEERNLSRKLSEGGLARVTVTVCHGVHY